MIKFFIFTIFYFYIVLGGDDYGPHEKRAIFIGKIIYPDAVAHNLNIPIKEENIDNIWKVFDAIKDINSQMPPKPKPGTSIENAYEVIKNLRLDNTKIFKAGTSIGNNAEGFYKALELMFETIKTKKYTHPLYENFIKEFKDGILKRVEPHMKKLKIELDKYLDDSVNKQRAENELKEHGDTKPTSKRIKNYLGNEFVEKYNKGDIIIEDASHDIASKKAKNIYDKKLKYC